MIYSFITPLSQQETTLMADLYMGCNIPLTAAHHYEKWIEQIYAQTPDQIPDQVKDDIVDKICKISHAYQAGCEQASALEWIEKGLAIKKIGRAHV